MPGLAGVAGGRGGSAWGGLAVLRALRAVASGFLGRSLLGRRSVLAPAGVLAPLRSTWPCAPSRLAASVAPSSVAARCSARLRPSGRAGPASLCCGRLATLRPALGLAVPARRRVALRRSLPPCPPLGARACAPPRGVFAPWPWLRAFASPFVGRFLLARRSVLGPAFRSRRLRPLAVAARLRVALRRSLPRRPPLGARALAPPDPPGRPAATSSHSRQPRLDRRPHPRPAGHGGNGGNPPDRRPPTLATPTANAGNADRQRWQRRPPTLATPTANAGNADRQRWQRQRRKNDTTSSTGRNTTSSTDNDTPNVLRASAPDRVNDTANDTDYDTDNDTKHDTPYRNKNNNKNLFARACESRILEAEMPGREGSM